MELDAAFVDEITGFRFEECVNCERTLLAERVQPVIEVGFDASASYEERGAIDADYWGGPW